MQSRNWHAEDFAIGCAIADPSVLERWADKVDPHDFQLRRNQHWWRMMRALMARGEPADPATLAARFPYRTQKLGGAGVLLHLSFYASAHLRNADTYFRQIVESAQKRRLVAELREVAQVLENPEVDHRPILQRLQGRLTAMTPKTDSAADLEWVFEHIAQVRADPESAWGIRTGWTDLDNITMGWQRGELIIVGGRPSMGKTAFALEIAARSTQQGYKTMVFSLEMSRRMLYLRMAALLNGIPLRNLQQGRINDDEFRRVSESLSFMERIAIEDQAGMTADGIVAEMRRMRASGGIDLAIVDYLGLVQEPPLPNDHAGSRVGRIAEKFKSAAKELNIPVLALSQVRREVESRQNKRPSMSDLAESSAVEAHSDVVVLLYRDDYYHRQSEKPNVLEVNVAKHRNGMTGIAELFFDRETQRILSLEKRR